MDAGNASAIKGIYDGISFIDGVWGVPFEDSLVCKFCDGLETILKRRAVRLHELQEENRELVAVRTHLLHLLILSDRAAAAVSAR